MLSMGLRDVAREFVRPKAIMLNSKPEGPTENYKFPLR